jgi:NTE family protein
MNRPMVGLSLSGGGARGLAHIGVLKVLEREGIPIDCVSGASMGGVLAAAYAAGLTPAHLESIALRMSSLRRLVRLVDLRRPRRGLLSGDKLRAFLAQFLPPELTFADLQMPLALEAVDLRTGEEVGLTGGSVLEATLATSAYPGVLPPVVIEGRCLVDGGVLDNLPIDLTRSLGAERVIAVDVSSGGCPGDGWDPLRSASLMPDFLEMAFNALIVMVMARTRAKLQSDPPDVLIRPRLTHDIGTFSSFTRAAEIIRLGEQATVQALLGGALCIEPMPVLSAEAQS